MFCRRCRYQLTGVPAGPCPECGRPFDPDHPRTYLASPERLTRRQRRWILVLALLTAFAAAVPFLPYPYAGYTEIDANSGRERTVHRFFGLALLTLPRSTAIGAFSAEHLAPLPAPDWRPAHRWTPFDNARVNFRAGGWSGDLESLLNSTERKTVPLPDRIRLVKAAFHSLRSGSDLWIDTEHGVAVMDHEGTVIAEWKRSQ